MSDDQGCVVDVDLVEGVEAFDAWRIRFFLDDDSEARPSIEELRGGLLVPCEPGRTPGSDGWPLVRAAGPLSLSLNSVSLGITQDRPSDRAGLGGRWSRNGQEVPRLTWPNGPLMA
jgi:hypothetical protein